MKVIDIISGAKGPAFSFEIIPPPRGRTVFDLIEIVDSLMPLKPQWIDVTSHASSVFYQENEDGTLKRRTYKKHPGTLGICGVIQNRFRIDTVAHVLCLGFSKEETEDALIELNYLGVENVLCLRGDNPNYQKPQPKERSYNQYAVDLVRQVRELNQGRYLQEIANSSPLRFCVGVAGYPEKHFEAPNRKVDIQYLKQKVEAGAEYIVSQMFYDNQFFFDFVADCRAAGITVPIIPGLKVIRSVHQLKTVPRTFHVNLPDSFVDEILASPDHAAEIGMRWTQRQVEGLLNAGHKNVHFYVMNDAHLVSKALGNILK